MPLHKQYSKKAMPQLTRMIHHREVEACPELLPKNLRCPYQASVIKVLERNSSRTVYNPLIYQVCCLRIWFDGAKMETYMMRKNFYTWRLFNASRIFMPLPKTGAKRSAGFRFNREGIVLIVNCAGSRPCFTSFQSSGVETVAPGLGRALYAEARVWPRLFWR